MKSEAQKLRWYLFYRDQLLLQERPEGLAIPSGAEPPVAVDRTFTVDYQGAGTARAAHLAAPVELSGYRMMGLRASALFGGWPLPPSGLGDPSFLGTLGSSLVCFWSF